MVDYPYDWDLPDTAIDVGDLGLDTLDVDTEIGAEVMQDFESNFDHNPFESGFDLNTFDDVGFDDFGGSFDF